MVNKHAADRAMEAGLLVVTDKCMLKEHQRICKGKVVNVECEDEFSRQG